MIGAIYTSAIMVIIMVGVVGYILESKLDKIERILKELEDESNT